jgi:signal transduction histidine kinase
MGKKSIILVFILFLLQQNITVLAQPSVADSLHRLLSNCPTPEKSSISDTIYFPISEALCNQYFNDFELDSVHQVCNRILLMLDALSSAKTAASISARLEYYKMRFNRLQGRAYHTSGQDLEALIAFQKYNVLAEKLSSVLDIGNSNIYIAYCHRELEDYALSYQYALKATKIFEPTEYKIPLGHAYMVIATYYNYGKENSDSSKYFLQKAIQLYLKHGRPEMAIGAYADLTELFNDNLQPDSSLYYLSKIQANLEEISEEDKLRYYGQHGAASFIKGNVAQAISSLNLAIELSKEMNTPEIEYNIKRYLALALAADGQFRAAAKCQNEGYNAYDKDVNTEKARALNTAQLNFEFDRKTALANLELQKQKRLKDLSLLGLLLGAMVAGLVYWLYRQSKIASRILAEKNAQIEKSYQDLKETQEQLVLTEKQREAQSVRVAIARDIHDELGAGLTKITMMSDMLRRKASVDNPEMAEMLHRIVANAKGVSASLTEIVWAVNPSHDSLESLSNYLKNYAVHYLDGIGIESHFDFPLQVPACIIDPELKRNIFLVLKESLNNTVKYAKSKDVWASFQTDGQTFKLGVRDNGVGFDLQEISPDSGGNGLLNMKTRMEQLGCTLSIQSQPGEGTSIIATGPLL